MAMDRQEKRESNPSPMHQYALEWAQRERKKADFVRSNAVRLNLDAARFVSGQIIEVILNDDSNCFDVKKFEKTPLYTQALEAQRAAILERLDWESSCTEVPENVRNQLSQTRDSIKDHPWLDKETFEHASAGWYQMRQSVAREVDGNDDLQADQVYFRKNQPLVDREYTASGGK